MKQRIGLWLHKSYARLGTIRQKHPREAAGELDAVNRVSVGQPIRLSRAGPANLRGGLARGISSAPVWNKTAATQLHPCQATTAFRRPDAKRTGIDGTIPPAVCACDLRQVRYRGLAISPVPMNAIGVAVDLYRWFDGWTSALRLLTRVTPFARLAPWTRLVSTCWRRA